MTTFVLIPGAGGMAWYWSRVVPLLEAGGHRAVAVDLPGDDNTAGLERYTELVIEAMAGLSEVALVAQSLGGFTAAMVCARVPAGSLTFVNAMIPEPGETPGAWWANTGAVEARASAAATNDYGDFDEMKYFFHDVAPDVVAEAQRNYRPESDAVFESRCEFEGWPPIPIRVLVGADDRFFPAAFQRRVARERLDVEAEALPGGHLIALAQPALVANYLLDDSTTSEEPSTG
ncbi:MAG TPA: alpha/beta hydrolase [Acidimicrobiia bacterium]|nr:alpha/beta hydrolase [Acidimicrobiia bacterium]